MFLNLRRCSYFLFFSRFAITLKDLSSLFRLNGTLLRRIWSRWDFEQTSKCLSKVKYIVTALKLQTRNYFCWVCWNTILPNNRLLGNWVCAACGARRSPFLGSHLGTFFLGKNTCLNQLSLSAALLKGSCFCLEGGG